MTASAGGLAWRHLPRAAQIYVAAVIAVGSVLFVALLPHDLPQPLLFAALFGISCITSTWKVTLPIALSSGSTLSVSYAADLMALLLLGPRQAMVIAVAGVVTQCTVNLKQPYPFYRTVFSATGEAITIAVTSAAYGWLGGSTGSLAFFAIAKPLVGAIAAYFCVNTGLVAGAIGLSTHRAIWVVWRDDFLWSASSFMVAASAGAFAAVVVDRGDAWKAMLMLAPVYTTYRTYQLFVGRLDLLERERAARASAEQANRIKDQFLAVVSHELRTPLNAILGWADMLRRGAVDPHRHDRAFRAIYDSARRQAQLIDELLDVSRIMSGKLELELSPEVDVADVVAKAVEMVQPSADAKGIDITTDFGDAIGVIAADSARLQQVVWNLLVNAIKFSPNGSGVNLRLRRSQTMIELVVADRGQGIAADFLPFVFESFRQADGSTTRRQGGLGLGLSIVKHLVEAHGGTIKAESIGVGRGATFVVQLPTGAVRATSWPAAISSSRSSDDEREQPVASLDGLSVLVVDDDDESRTIVAEYLQGQQAVVLTASSARQACDVLRTTHVDVLLADIAMPEEDGYSLIRRVRAGTASGVPSSIPAVALTSFARAEDRQRALQAGFHLHLTKPVDRRRLIESIDALGRGKLVGAPVLSGAAL